MSIKSDVIAETSIDLDDPKLISNTLAPALAERLTTVFPAFGEAKQAVTSIMTAYKTLTSTPTVVGAVGVAISAVGAAAGFLEGRLDKDIEGNMKRWETARNRTIERWIKPGDWSTVLYANGLPVGDVDLYNNAFGWDESDFLAQYNEGVVWMSHRTARSDILLPTWDSPPFTSGYGFISGDKGVEYPAWSPLTGFTINKRKHRLGQPSVAPIPASYDETYFGTLPSASLAELSDAGLEGAPKFLQRLIVKMEAAFYNQAFIPPPDYHYLFSIGTYPYTSWGTTNNGIPGLAGSVTLNSRMAALAAAIHSLTPVHALVRSEEVEKCYRAWLRCTRIRNLPRLPKGQVDQGIYLDENLLPWSPVEVATIGCVAPAPKVKPEPQYQFQKDNAKRCAADPSLADLPNTQCFPDDLIGTMHAVHWKAAREIEQAFRSFFALRRAAIYQMDKTTDAFRSAAASSPDPVIAAAARGTVPEYRPWSATDPLGDGWNKPKVNPNVGGGPKDKKPSGEPTPPGPKPKPTPKPAPGGGSVAVPRPSNTSRWIGLGVAGAAGLAAVGYKERARLRAWAVKLAQRFRRRP